MRTKIAPNRLNAEFNIELDTVTMSPMGDGGLLFWVAFVSNQPGCEELSVCDR